MDLLNVAKSFYKIKPVKIDTVIFRMNYKWTGTVFFLAFAALVTSNYFGNPMACTSNREIDATTVVNTYCWASGKSYIVTNPEPMWTLGANTEPQAILTVLEHHRVKYMTMFRWLPWIMAFHAISFFAPHVLWKFREGGCLSKLLCVDMKTASTDEWADRRNTIINRVAAASGGHRGYGRMYIFCEILNFVVSVINLLAMDRYLDVDLYGLHSTDLMKIEGTLPIETILWPNVVKCGFKQSGPGGNVVTYDFLCVLAHAHVYNKITTLLWFWLLAMSFLNLIGVFARIITVLFKTVQVTMISDLAPRCSLDTIKSIMKKTSFGDYLIYVGLGEALSQDEFGEILVGVEQRLMAIGV